MKTYEQVKKVCCYRCHGSIRFFASQVNSENEIECQQCGYKVPLHKIECQACGQQFPMSETKCPRCGCEEVTK